MFFQAKKQYHTKLADFVDNILFLFIMKFNALFLSKKFMVYEQLAK